MMALHPRKFLFADPNFDKKFSPDCYMCYVCPEKCYISPPPPPPQLSEPDPGNSHVSRVLIFMLCILGVAFVIFSYLTIARYRFRNSRRRNPENSRADFVDENQGPVLDHHIWYIRTVGLPQPVIDSIALFTFKKSDGLIESSDCSVCLSGFQENERLRLLPKCSHAFHVGCIDTWLRSHTNCPVCRAPILIGSANNARPSPNESSSSSSGSEEGNHVENELENRGEIERDESRETRATEIMRMQEDRKAKHLSKNMVRVLSDLGNQRVKIDQVRRSVSVDFSSASMIYQAVAEKKGGEGCSDTKLETNSSKNSSIYRLIKSSSCARSLQKGPVSMKRSFSFTGKRSLRKNSGSQESIQIAEVRVQIGGG